jgi:hypothetical protein
MFTNRCDDPAHEHVFALPPLIMHGLHSLLAGLWRVSAFETMLQALLKTIHKQLLRLTCHIKHQTAVSRLVADTAAVMLPCLALELR